MPLSNEHQAYILALAAFFLALGTYTAAIPDAVPSDIRVPISVFFWICGVVGFALKEALGGAPPQTAVTQSQMKALEHYAMDRYAELSGEIRQLAKAHPETEPPPAPTPPSPLDPSSETSEPAALENPT